MAFDFTDALRVGKLLRSLFSKGVFDRFCEVISRSLCFKTRSCISEVREVKEALKTMLQCGICYAIGAAIVWGLWPTLSTMTAHWPSWMPGALATTSSFAMFYVITHMQRGQMSPHGKMFVLSYAVVCLGFAGSTIHPSQYNAGTASVELAFVVMLGWKLATYKEENEVKE